MQLTKLKSGTKNGSEVTLKLSSIVFFDSNDETTFPHKLFLTNTRVLRFWKAFSNSSSTNIKLPKNQLLKLGQTGGFLDRLFGPFLKTGLSLMKNVLKLLPNSVLISLGLTATDADIHKKKFVSGIATLIISNEEIMISWK